MESAPCVSLITNSRPGMRLLLGPGRAASFMIRSVSEIREPTTASGINEMASAASQPFGSQSAGSAIRQTGNAVIGPARQPEDLVPRRRIHLRRD